MSDQGVVTCNFEVAQEMNGSRRSKSKNWKRQASVFAALGDETRLILLARLCDAHQVSITQLASDSPLTRQAITKHLRVLERAGIVQGVRSGRETLFELHRTPLVEASDYLQVVCRGLDESIGRLKAFVERASS
jgi:DNA-binding transcriptional ArsR family regulator